MGAMFPFDIIVLDKAWPGEIDNDWDAHVKQTYKRLQAMMTQKSLFIHYAGTAWDLPSVQKIHHRLGELFPSVRTMHSSTIEQFPWHDISVVAGSVDVLNVDWAWWKKQKISTIFYHQDLHPALFVPPAVVSRALGLQLPTVPDLEDCQTLNKSLTQPATSVWLQPGHASYDTDGLEMSSGEVLIAKKSAFQGMQMRQNKNYVSLFLDKELQLTTVYGDFYHEAHVHPAMAALGERAQRVLVIGGGDGGVTTLALKYPIKELVQLEIDQMVVDAAKKYMPTFSAGYSDPRTKLVIGDAIAYVNNAASTPELAGKQFDLVIIDSTDQPLKSPWTKEFFKALKSIMAPHGAVLQNVGSMGDWLPEHQERQKAAFNYTFIINCNTPEYPSPYFLSLSTDALDPMKVDWEYWSGLNIDTIYYHPTMHFAMFEVPLETKKMYKGEDWVPLDAEQMKPILKKAGKRYWVNEKKPEDGETKFAATAQEEVWRKPKPKHENDEWKNEPRAEL